MGRTHISSASLYVDKKNCGMEPRTSETSRGITSGRRQDDIIKGKVATENIKTEKPRCLSRMATHQPENKH